MDWLWYILAGLGSGVVAGMGMGGGTLLIPILTIFLAVGQQIAQGVNLVAFIPTALVAIVIHCKNKLVDFATGIPLIIGGVIMAIIGAILAINLSSEILKKLFGAFLLAVGVWQIIYTIISSKDKSKCVFKNIKIENM